MSQLPPPHTHTHHHHHSPTHTHPQPVSPSLPQVAAFHSLVGLAAVCTSIASYMSADPAHIDGMHMTTTFLGTLIGAITLTG